MIHVCPGLHLARHLFNRHKLFDHAWLIGRNDQEPWALISEPYVPPAIPDAIETLRQEFHRMGTSD